MSYNITLQRLKNAVKDIINYINELGEDIDFEIENKSHVREAIEKGHDWW